MSAPHHRLAWTAVVLGVFLTGGAFGLDRLAGDGRASPGDAGSGTPPPPVADLPGPSTLTLPDEPRLVLPPVAADPAAAVREPVLSLPGEFPTDGPGTFTVATGEGPVLGETGQLRRFRLAVEDGVDEDLGEFAGFVDGTLGDPQSWITGGEVRFQRVPDGAGHDFTIYLATSATTVRLCAEGGLDVIGYGLPDGGVSCRTPGRVILNLSRWRQSVPQYVDAGVPLESYRQMLLNHEVGHELGYGHVPCPAAGEPAPVMQQQTIDLAGCVANPWPFPSG